MRFVPINAVKNGSRLAKTIYDDNGRMLLRKGIRLTEKLKKSLIKNRIYSVYIDDDYSDIEIEDVIKPELRQKAIMILKNTFNDFRKMSQEINKTNSNSKRWELYKKQSNHIENILKITKLILDEILSKKNILINLVDIKSYNNYTYQHSVNVAVLSLILGIELQLNKTQLYNLCVGAMLHDIGKIFIPEEILLKKGKLSENEYAIMKKHTEEGYTYLKKIIDIAISSKIVALQHHERIDGTGYPYKISGNSINKLAKAVSIVDVYDALTSDRPYRQAMPPNEAIEYIMANGNTQFDLEMVKIFVRKIVPYPPGTLVKLSNKDIAVVEEVFPNFPLRPKVKIIKSENPHHKNIHIDLMKETNIVITGIQYVVPD